MEKFSYLHPFNVDNYYFLFNTKSIKIATISKGLYFFINLPNKNPSFSTSRKGEKLEKNYLEELFHFAKDEPSLRGRTDFAMSDCYSNFNDIHSLQDLTLVVCEDCNLRCEYCYLIEKLDKKNYMNKKTCFKALELFFKHAQSPVHISFFGGEPLLNFDIIKNATAYALDLAKKCNFRCSFGLVTNGTICNEKIFEHLTKYRFLVNISLDGPPKIHNLLRKFKSGQPTFDRIMANIKRYYTHYPDKNLIRFSPTIFHEHYNKIEYLYNFFKEIEDNYRISFNIFGDLKCVEDRERFKVQETTDYLKVLFKYGELIFREIKKEGSFCKLFKKVRMPLEFFKVIFGSEIRHSICGAGIKSIIVYPDGRISGCRQLDATICHGADLSWGNIFSNNYKEDLRLTPVKATIKQPDVCNSCFIKNICSGFCPAYAYHANKNFATPDSVICEIQKAYFKISMWIVAKAIESGIPLTRELLKYHLYGGIKYE